MTRCWRRLRLLLGTGTIAAMAMVMLGTAPALGVENTDDPPRIISNDEFAENSDLDPADLMPITQPAIATGDNVDQFTGLLAQVSGLPLAGPPILEAYEGDLESVRVDLGVDPEEEVFVTRVSVETDVPESVLNGDADTVQTLPSGTQLLTSLDAASGAVVSTLSTEGELTVWNAPYAADSQQASTIADWAIAADAGDPGTLNAQAEETVAPLAAPSCNTDVFDPFTSGGYIGVSMRLLCNQKGHIMFSGYLLQYRGLGVWVSKAAASFNGSGASVAVITPRWNCSTGDNQLYRGRAQTRQIRNSNGSWHRTGTVEGPQRRLTCS